MAYGDRKFILSVVDPRTKQDITSGCMVFVYTAGSKTLATIYANESRTAKTNPITRAQFAVDANINFSVAAESVDIFVADDKGNVAFIPSVAPEDHVIPLNRDDFNKMLVAPFLFNSGGTEVDTGLDFPLNVWIYNLMVEVVTVDATETIDVGLLSSETAGDADGLLKAVSLGTAGFIRPFLNVDTTTEDYIGTPYFGALMGVGSAGSSTALHYGSTGGMGHVVSGANARSWTYTPSTSDTAAGYIYAMFRHLR